MSILQRSTMLKLWVILSIAATVAVLGALAIMKPARAPLVAQLTHQHRPAHRMPTLTELPEFPGIPLHARHMSKQRQHELVQALILHKISTWPTNPSRGHRTGKFTSTGIFGGFAPTEEQIARIAPNYDNVLFGANNSSLVPRFRRYNPEITFLIYVDSGLNPGFKQADAGGVDEEDTKWIVGNHPEWLLRDADGNPIRSVGGFSNPGAYWPDPGNEEWQEYFVNKITKLLGETGGHWDGILFDQFIATADGHARYAKSVQQVNYPTDEAFQAAYLRFLEAVAAKLSVPIVVNMEGGSIVRNPDFVGKVARTAGGAENEIFPEEMPIEDMRPYLEVVQNLPSHVHIRINSKPAGWAGNIDRTLFAYYCYLLIADEHREIYWTHKEGTSDIPHYWYREFDLDLGRPEGNIQFGTSIWSRAFEHAVVIVNPGKEPAEYSWPASVRFYDVERKPLRSPLVLDKRKAMLLVKDLSILHQSGTEEEQ